MSPQGYMGNKKKKHFSHPSDSFQLTGMWEELSSGMSPPLEKAENIVMTHGWESTDLGPTTYLAL